MLDPNAVIDDFLSSHDLDYAHKDENTYLITLPGEAKQQTHCALVVGDHSLSIYLTKMPGCIQSPLLLMS